MPDYPYLIIGGGMTAAAAVKGIRSVDESGPIGLISAEVHPPYDRPPLTKSLWKDAPTASIWSGLEDVAGLDLHLGRRVERLLPDEKRAVDASGIIYGYDKLLLATGGDPIRLPFTGDDPRIIYYRSVDDYWRLRARIQDAGRIAVVGGGFIGSEIAAALAMNDQPVVMAFLEETIGAGRFPPDLGRFLNDYYRERGVDVRGGMKIVDVQPGDDRVRLVFEPVDEGAKEEVEADAVVIGIGIKPGTGLAEAAGLRVDNGIVVDATLQTSAPDIYAAGDVARFPHPALDGYLRVEHENNAKRMGKLAGQNMAGQNERYDYLPFFYSDMFDLGYEAVGELNNTLNLHAVWEDPNRKGIVYYYDDDGTIRGVLLWNTWGKVKDARALIGQKVDLQDGKLVNGID